MSRLSSIIGVVLGVAGSALGAAEPLQTFTVKDYLRHSWTNEIVHFPVSYRDWRMPKALTLTDSSGRSVPSQVSGLGRSGWSVTGTIWTVVSVPPKGEVVLQLRKESKTGTDKYPSSSSVLSLASQGQDFVLANEFMSVLLPRLPGPLPNPVELASLPPPFLALAAEGTNWLGRGVWTNAGPPLLVKNAATTVIEQGPVRTTVRYRLTFADGRFYQADITLGARQDAVLFTDETDVDATNALFRLSFQPSLMPDRVFWRNNFYADSYKGLTGEAIPTGRDQLLFQLCPWSFWWQQNRTTWAGLYRHEAVPFIGVLAVRPSRWLPAGWDGFDRTMIPFTARPGGQVDADLGLMAWTQKKADGTNEFSRAHRELAFTAGRAADFVDKAKMAILKEAETALRDKDNGKWNLLLGKGMWLFKLRRQLTQYSEFPLDEVKDFSLDFKPASPGRKHPYLLFAPEDLDRARQQAKTNPALKVELTNATTYITRLNPEALIAKIRKEPDGWQAFFRENYVGNGMYECTPLAYVCDDNPTNGILLAAGVKGLATQVADQFLNNPERPSLGANAHMAGTTLLRLLLAYDAIAESGHLTPADKADIEAVLVFGGYVFDHPDYWNTDVGLCSANPNMTSLLRLPLGLLGLFLDGHPRSAHWLEFAENELQSELKNGISKDGAWLECPFYQAPTLDGMFMLAQAVKNVKGKDYFADPNFKATMDYYGFLLTPPDARYPTNTPTLPLPMTVPGVGDAFPFFTTSFNGWMARVTAQSDPAFSARQQFYWQQQTYSWINGGRASSFMPALCDIALPAAAPVELSRAFEGFGNILRTSWTDRNASYLAHRCGYFTHHFDPGDPNSIIYYAKGAPLCMDFAHRGATAEEVTTMWRPDYHNAVSFNRPGTPNYWGASVGPVDANRQGQEVRSLPATVDYSTGVSFGSGGQKNNRHVLLVKSADPLGATYLVMRDITQDGQPNQEFTWNLWCVAKEPEFTGNVAHFPGLYGVDLDAHVLTPAAPQFVKDRYRYEQYVWPWWGLGKLPEEQTGVHVRKSGSKEDFFTVLYPRAAGQAKAQVRMLTNGRAVEVGHMEGQDTALLSPGQPVAVTNGDVRLSGEIAFARRCSNGDLRLAVIKGMDATAVSGPWELRSSGAVAIEVKGTVVSGESSGVAHDARIGLPPDYGAAVVMLDGKPATGKREGNVLSIVIPGGAHVFKITPK